jgi:uncharacterized membrane protein YfcA
MVSTLLLVAVVFWLAGLIKGISGMGLATIAMALLSLFMPPAHAAMLMVVPSLATNLAQCIGKQWSNVIKRFWAMWLALGILTAYSPYSGLNTTDSNLSAIALGVVLIVYGAWGLRKPQPPKLSDKPLVNGGIAGALTGLITATTGVFVMPLVPYLQTLKLSREEFIQTLGISFTVATLGLAVRLGGAPNLDWGAHTDAIVIGVIAAFIGLWMGTKTRNKLNSTQFQNSLYGVFTLLGLIMITKSLT